MAEEEFLKELEADPELRKETLEKIRKATFRAQTKEEKENENEILTLWKEEKEQEKAHKGLRLVKN